MDQPHFVHISLRQNQMLWRHPTRPDPTRSRPDTDGSASIERAGEVAVGLSGVLSRKELVIWRWR